VLVQTLQGEITGQYRELCDVVKTFQGVNILTVELTLGQFNMLVKMNGEKIESLISAQSKIKALKFVQNTAAIVTYSEGIVPDAIGSFKVTHDAKEEVLQYLGTTQQNIINDVYDLKKTMETLLSLAKNQVKQGENQITSTEIRVAEQEIKRREEKFKKVVRTVAAIVGTCLIIPPIALAITLLISPQFNLTFQMITYMMGLSIVGLVSILIAVDYRQVRAAIKIAIKIVLGKHSSKRR